jgi:hypothetical protein
MRTLRELNLQGGDVSVVTYPASPTTSASLRSKDLHEARCVFVEQMAREMRAGAPLSSENMAKLQQVLRELARPSSPSHSFPAPVVEEPQRGMTRTRRSAPRCDADRARLTDHPPERGSHHPHRPDTRPAYSYGTRHAT